MVNYYCSSNVYQSYSMTSKCHYIAGAIIIRECILSLANLTSPQNHKKNLALNLHFKYTYLPSQDTVPDVYPFHFVKLRLDKEDN